MKHRERVLAYETRFGKGKYTEPFGQPLADNRALDSYIGPDPNRPDQKVGQKLGDTQCDTLRLHCISQHSTIS